MAAITIIDKAKAALSVKFLESVFGVRPLMYTYDDHIEIDFTPAQVKYLKSKLHKSVWANLVPRPGVKTEPPKIQIRFDKVIIPWSIETLSPLMAGSFAMGMLTNHMFSRKK